MTTRQPYKFFPAKAQSWDYIENRYRKDFGHCHFKLIELVEHIKKSKLSDRLFGSTSLDKLVVSIYEELHHEKEALYITFDLYKNEWHFKYFAVPFRQPEFTRIYPADKGIEKFDNFIKMINW